MHETAVKGSSQGLVTVNLFLVEADRDYKLEARDLPCRLQYLYPSSCAAVVLTI